MKPVVPSSAAWRWPRTAAVVASVGVFAVVQASVVAPLAAVRPGGVRVGAWLLASWLPWLFAAPALVQRAADTDSTSIAAPGALRRHAWAWLLPTVVAAVWGGGLALLGGVLLPGLPGAPGAGASAAAGPGLALTPGGASPGAGWPLPLLGVQALSSLFLYGALLRAGAILARGDRRALRRAAMARLDALRHPVEPLALRDALAAVAKLVRAGAERGAHEPGTAEILVRAGRFVHEALQRSEPCEAVLGDELELARLYLDIARARLAQDLQVEFAVADRLASAVVPGLILLPLLENALRHGIASRPQAGKIRIGAVKAGARLLLTVHNDGPRMPDGAQSGEAAGGDRGVAPGLASVRGRLHALHGPAAKLALRNVDAGGVLASISLPFREAPASATPRPAPSRAGAIMPGKPS